MNIDEAIGKSTRVLSEAGIEEARREAGLLLAFAISSSPTFLIAHPEYELTDEEAGSFESIVRRRASREPFHYITGTKEFFGHEFRVEPGVLIPRPETEGLVEKAIELLKGGSSPRFLEIGVGSGCISISILRSIHGSSAVGVDISATALNVAGENAKCHGVSDRFELRRGDLFADVTERFDGIVTNPPYVPSADIDKLQPEVKDHEPPGALFSGEDGLDLIKEIIKQGQKYLRPGGFLLMEIGFGQAGAVRKLLEENGWCDVHFILDLQQIPRIASARYGLPASTAD